ncbi:flavin-binding monooxygenase [Xylariaceae sp. FL1272]|nr:flavin-binding monooxygenase [Xylariaceae sp. FL1272]
MQRLRTKMFGRPTQQRDSTPIDTQTHHPAISDDPLPFTIEDKPLDGHRRMKVRVIGAGFSGIYLGIRIPQRLRNVDLQIYEKNAGVGGTWWLNRYPGIACDIPAHSYQYSFNPNPTWSSFYAPGSEICQYLQSTAEKYGVMRFIKLRHEVGSCKWDNNNKKWLLEIHNLETGERFLDDADVLVVARGLLATPAWPEIDGLKQFQGELVHSARWNEKYDYRNQRIGVIGNGSSGIQIVPSLQKLEGVQLSCFVRSKTWILNPFGEAIMKELGMDIDELDFSPARRQEFAQNPEEFYRFRKAIEVGGNTIHEVSMRDTAMQRGGKAMLEANMRKRLASRPDIADFLIPSFGIGCRRSTPGPGYLEALAKDNVEFITDGVKSISGRNIKLESGRQLELDVLVCATGFDVNDAPQFPIVGQGGLTLAERYKPVPEAYMSTAIDSFPNLFVILGPNSAIGSGSLTMILETLGDYAIKCIRKLQKEDYASMTIKPERMRDWNEYCCEYFKRTVYTEDCKSWYKSDGGKGDRVIGLWPGSTLHALEALRAPRWEDYDFESRYGENSNLLKWLGNGSSITHLKSEDGESMGQKYQGDPAWYLEPMLQNVPIEGQPEDDAEFKLRPFSH